MDQTRQAVQLCGKLLFAQMSEMLNVKMNNGLPPNLNGSDITVGACQAKHLFFLLQPGLWDRRWRSELRNWKLTKRLNLFLTDFAYKGTDISMAAYMSELDWLTPPLTNHVLSAEMHNQAVNSLALISARRYTLRSGGAAGLIIHCQNQSSEMFAG